MLTELLRATAPLALAAALLATPALAQEAAAPEPPADDILVTAQRTNQSEVIRGGQVGVFGDKAAEDVPFSIKSYNSALILNQQPQTIGQVLENDPSVRLSYGFGNAAELFIIRGFPLFGDDVGLNGLYGIAPRQLIAPELFDSVQVLNGASAFINGAAPGGSGIGGSVNLVLKRAGETPLTRGTVNYTSSGHVGGALDVSRRTADGRFGFRVNGVYRSGDVSVDDEFRKATVAGGAFDYDGGNVRLALDVGYQRNEVRGLRHKITVATTTIPRVPDADHNYSQPFTYSILRDIFGVVSGEWDVADNAMLYGSFGARDGSEQGIYGGITVNDALTGAASGDALYVPRTDNNEAAQIGMRVKLAALGTTHEINFGGSYVWQVNRNAYDFRYGPGYAGFATNIYDTPAVPLPSSALVGGDLDDPYPMSRTRIGSVFASDTIGFADDRVLLTAGLRLQKIATRTYSATGGAQVESRDDDAITPVVGLVVKPVTGVSLFANRIEGLAQGPVAPLTGFVPSANATLPVINSGQQFAPYRSVQYEIGGKLALGRVNASLAVFQIAQPIGQVTADTVVPGFGRYGLSGEQRNRGIELSVDGELTRGLRVIAGGAINDAKLRDTPGGLNDDNDAPGIPDYTANANVEWDLSFVPGLTLTGRVVQTGKQKVDQANTLEIDAWTRFDLGARYVAVVAETPLTLRFGVDNVANNRYWASAFDSFNQTLLQGAPRTYKASLTVDF